MKEKLEEQKNYLLLSGMDSLYNISYGYGEVTEYLELLSANEMLRIVI